MTIISITNGVYSNSKEIIDILADRLGCKKITDHEIIETTSNTQGIKLKSLLKTIDSKNIAFNDFTHEKEKCIAGLKKTLSEYVLYGNFIFHGILGHLIPNEFSHALKVLIITDTKHRIANGVKEEKLSEAEISEKIKTADRQAILWTNALFKKKAWDALLYDVVIPTDKLSIVDAVDLIIKQTEVLSKLPDEVVMQEDENFALSALIESELAELGAGFCTKVDAGNVIVTIEKNVMMLSNLKRKIIDLISTIKGVKTVEVSLGRKFYDATTITRNYEFETPTRILLVDDEKEFVQTLSERLKMRQLESDIAYSGQAALDFADREDIEVMILDLKMPGIDGFEVLRKLKETKPDIEVIILTGHGSETDRKICMDLGAFAYLQKPADIDLLTVTMKDAYKKINKI
jgi:two-component system, OmpR family, response regulator CpxR